MQSENSGAVAVSQLTKIWDDQKKALNNLSLTIKTGDFYALLGPNGAGKSTLINIICSLTAMNHGSVSIFGQDLTTKRQWCKRQIGLVPQEFNFNQWEPIVEIVATTACLHGYGLAEATKRAKRVLAEVGLEDKIGGTAIKLSGGMKRRLMIARAMVSEPKLLILDEPTTGVDIELRLEVWRYLEEKNRAGTTILLTTHYLDEAEKLCRTVGFIKEGAIHYQGQMETVSKLLDQRTLMVRANKTPSFSSQSPITITASHQGSITIDVPRDYPISSICDQFSKQQATIQDIKQHQSDLEAVFLKLAAKNEH